MVVLFLVVIISTWQHIWVCRASYYMVSHVRLSVTWMDQSKTVEVWLCYVQHTVAPRPWMTLKCYKFKFSWHLTSFRRGNSG